MQCQSCMLSTLWVNTIQSHRRQTFWLIRCTLPSRCSKRVTLPKSCSRSIRSKPLPMKLLQVSNSTQMSSIHCSKSLGIRRWWKGWWSTRRRTNWSCFSRATWRRMSRQPEANNKPIWIRAASQEAFWTIGCRAISPILSLCTQRSSEQIIIIAPFRKLSMQVCKILAHSRSIKAIVAHLVSVKSSRPSKDVLEVWSRLVYYGSKRKWRSKRTRCKDCTKHRRLFWGTRVMKTTMRTSRS